MTEQNKLRILGKFFSKSRNEGCPHLDNLFALDDYWKEIYEQNRIRLSFEAATILANECVIAKVFSYDYV